MSLETWKAEFYPTPAYSKESKDAPVAHSLRKWEGLKPTNLEKHGVSTDPELTRQLVDDHERFSVGGTSCALCELHYESECRECPLYVVRGDYSCDQARPGENKSPWDSFSKSSDPSRMIYWLKRAAKIHP